MDATITSKAIARKSGLSRLLRFGVVGASGVLVNQGLLVLLHGVAGLALLPSSLVAVEASILSNFALNSAWTWRWSAGGSVTRWVRKAIQYHAATGASALLGNVLVLMALVHFFDVDYRIANLAGIAAASAANFLAGELWVFRRRSSAA